MVATPDFDRLADLLRSAKGCETFLENFKERSAPGNIDKYDEGFGINSRCTVFDVQTSFSAYTGSYGSSSVYTFQNGISPKIGAEYVVKAMNALRKDILAKMAELMRRDATALEGKARAEIEKMESLLASVLNDQTESEAA